MKKNVLIITRRFKFYKGLGTEKNVDNSHLIILEKDLFKIIRNGLKKNERLKTFLTKTLSSDDEDVLIYKGLIKTELIAQNIAKEEDEKLIIENNLKNTPISQTIDEYSNIESLRFLLEKQDRHNRTADSFSRHGESTDEKLENITCKKYFHLLNIIEPIDNIFVYAHWPSELELEKKVFLSALRKEIVNILIEKEKKIRSDALDDLVNVKTIEEKYCFNWLLHDSDILPHNYDGVILYENNYIYSSAINLVPDNLKDDNIWCFIHNMDTSDSYKKLIIGYETTFEKKIKTNSLTATDFRIELLLGGCLRRMKLMNIEKIDDVPVEQLCFIFQKQPTEQELTLLRNLVNKVDASLINE